MFESCRPDLRKPLGNKGLSAFMEQRPTEPRIRRGDLGATPALVASSSRGRSVCGTSDASEGRGRPARSHRSDSCPHHSCL